MKPLEITLVGSLMAAILLTAVPSAQAQWASPRWDAWQDSWRGSDWQDSGDLSRRRTLSSSDSAEGRVDVTRFVASTTATSQLGHGAITVESNTGDGMAFDASLRRTYEAAAVDALVGAGYDTLHPATTSGQKAKVTISKIVLSPAEAKGKPVSGVSAMEVGTRGQAYGLGINVDLSKPKTALVATRIDMQILEASTNTPLWEGYATIATREGDPKWSEYLIAIKLTKAVLNGFPNADATTVTP